MAMWAVVQFIVGATMVLQGQDSPPPAPKAAAPAAGQQTPPVSAEATAPAPKLFVKESVVDLGTIREGTVATAKFVIENHGNTDLVIQDVKASCGCTTVQLSQAEKTVKPEEQREILAKFDSKGRPGQQRKSISLVTNDTAQPNVNLIFRVNVETLFNVSPNTLVLQSAHRGSELAPVQVLPAGANQTVEITNVDISNCVLEYKKEPVEAEGGRKGVKLTFTLPADADLGAINGAINITGQIGEEKATVTVRARGEIVGDLTTVPAVVQSLTATPRGKVFPPVVVSATGETTFRVLSATAGPSLQLKTEVRKEGKEFFISPTLSDSAPDGPLATELVIRTDNTGQPLIRIPVYINVRPRYIVDPAVVLLRPEDAGNSRLVRVQQVSGEKLDITSVSCQNPAVAAEVDAKPGRTPDTRFIRVSLKDAAAATAGAKTEIVIKASIPGAEEIHIPVELGTPAS